MNKTERKKIDLNIGGLLIVLVFLCACVLVCLCDCELVCLCACVLVYPCIGYFNCCGLVTGNVVTFLYLLVCLF